MNPKLEPQSMRLIRFIPAGLLLLTLIACGGGGGSGSAPAPQAGGGTTTGGTTTGGNTTGGSTTGGGNAVSGPGTISLSGSLAPGGVEIGAIGSSVGVTLDVQGSGTGAPAFLFGDIQAFGSIILNGVEVETDNARFVIEGNTGSQSDLKQGQQVLLLADQNTTNANSVHYRANVKGPATAVTVVNAEFGTATLTVLGQTVRTDATTVYSNTRLSALAAGQLLEVSGTLNASGEILASFIERKSTLQEYKVMGRIGSATSTSFVIGGLTIDFTAATLANLSRNPAAGDVVEVKGDTSGFTAPAQLRATRVERLPALGIGTSVQARIEGFINNLQSATDFTVQGVRVVTNGSTTFNNGTASSPALGVKVQVVGASQSDGSILARSVTIQPTSAVRADGPVQAIDVTARTVTVLGVRFALRTLVDFEDDSNANVNPLSLSDLGLGDYVEVRGYLDGNTVVASRLERDDPQNRARLRGPVTAENAGAGTVDILSVRVTGQAGITAYRDRNDAAINQAQFHEAVGVGSFVRARWDNFVNTNQVVDELEIED